MGEHETPSEHEVRVGEIKQRWAKMPPTPWTVMEDPSAWDEEADAPCGGFIDELLTVAAADYDTMSLATARTLALAPEDIAYLLARVEALTAERDAAARHDEEVQSALAAARAEAERLRADLARVGQAVDPRTPERIAASREEHDPALWQYGLCECAGCNRVRDEWDFNGVAPHAPGCGCLMCNR